MDDPRDALGELLTNLGWEQTEGDQLVGITVAIHSVADEERGLMGCEILYFGPDDFEHAAMHGLIEVGERIVRNQHEEVASQN